MGRIRVSLALCALAALLAAGGGWAAAGLSGGDPSRGFSTKSNEADFAWTKESQTTTATSFTEVEGLAIGLCGGGGLISTLSAEVEGGPVEFRLRLGDKTLRPGPVRFEPEITGSSAVSYNFGIRNRGQLVDELTVEWRSTTGAEAVMRNGSLTAEAGPLKNAGCL